MASEVELLEVFRLGESADEVDIVREVGDLLAAQWLRVSQFRKVHALASRSLRMQSSPGTLVWAGLAQEKMGNLAAALGYFEQALPICREVGYRAGEATTLNNTAWCITAAGTCRPHWCTTSRRCPSSGRSGTGPVWP